MLKCSVKGVVKIGWLRTVGENVPIANAIASTYHRLIGIQLTVESALQGDG